MSQSRPYRELLRTLQLSGVRFLPKVILPEPTVAGTAVRRKKAERKSPTRKPGRPDTAQVLRESSPGLTLPVLDAASIASPEPLAQVTELIRRPPSATKAKEEAMGLLRGIVERCARCPELAGQRTRTVFGVGSVDARVLFVGEAPGADEDRKGEPFVGAAGQLLDRIIEATGMLRSDVYICNVLRCRPPGNRTPLPVEKANCSEFLTAQIRVVSPEYIVCWGSTAAQQILQVTTPVGRLRGRFHSAHDAQVLCTYHPSYLLRNPAAKRQVWDDMQLLMAELGLGK